MWRGKGACGGHGGETYTGFWWENRKDRENLEDVDIDERIILNWTLKN
jgi:hypothetical protein